MTQAATKTTLRYAVIEDNGGGLSLCVFDADDVCVWAHYGYEINPGQLSQDIAALQDGDDPRTGWDGGEEDPAGFWDSFRAEDYGRGWKQVADQDGNYPHRMGRAAQLEFDVEID